MAGYNPYYVYQPYYPATMPDVRQQIQPVQPALQPAVQQQSGPSFALVNNEQEARDFVVLPGNSVFLMSRNDSVFWLKTTDQSGLSTPLRTFDYTERPQGLQTAPQKEQQQNVQYVTREELAELEARVNALAAKKPTHTKEKEESGNG